MDNMMAFHASVNLIVNIKNIEDIGKILSRGITDTELFYNVYKESLKESGKAWDWIVDWVCWEGAVYKALPKMMQKNKYTCSDYREEMRLISLKKRQNEETLSQVEKQTIAAEIVKLEKILQLD